MEQRRRGVPACRRAADRLPDGFLRVRSLLVDGDEDAGVVPLAARRGELGGPGPVGGKRQREGVAVWFVTAASRAPFPRTSRSLSAHAAASTEARGNTSRVRVREARERQERP